MTERERLHALLLCSTIIETAARIERDLAAAKQAALEFAASIEMHPRLIETLCSTESQS